MSCACAIRGTVLIACGAIVVCIARAIKPPSARVDAFTMSTAVLATTAAIRTIVVRMARALKPPRARFGTFTMSTAVVTILAAGRTVVTLETLLTLSIAFLNRRCLRSAIRAMRMRAILADTQQKEQTKVSFAQRSHCSCRTLAPGVRGLVKSHAVA